VADKMEEGELESVVGGMRANPMVTDPYLSCGWAEAFALRGGRARPSENTKSATVIDEFVTRTLQTNP
jgi:hypothetical protein